MVEIIIKGKRFVIEKEIEDKFETLLILVSKLGYNGYYVDKNSLENILKRIRGDKGV